MRKRTGTTVVAGMLAVALVAAACGGDDDAGGDEAAAETQPGATDPAGTSAGSSAPSDCELDDAPLVVGLYEVQGESAVAVNSFDFGSKLAVKHINEAGGVCGQELQYDRTAPSISDAQVANAAFLEAVDKEPTALMGIPAPNQLAGLQAQIERAGIPTLSTSGAADQAFYGAEGVSAYNWKLANPDKNYVNQTVAFATEDLGLQRIALMGTTDLAPSTMEVAQGLVPDAGGEVTVALPYNPTSNDLTPQILQVANSDGLIHYCYPNTCAVQLNQFEQNGITLPTITTSSLTFVANVLVEGPALQNAYAVFSGCVLSADSERPGVADFYNAYVEEFGEDPNQGALQTYNGMMIIKKAIELAGSTDPEALNEALGEVSVTTEDGAICDDEYHADGAHYFFHDTIVVEYNEDGTSTEIKRVTNPDDEAVG